MEKKNTLGRGRTLGYASGIITESLIYNMYFTYYLVFLTTVAKLNPALAGTVSLISVIWDAVADPIIGYLADRKKADKRRFMARAIFPMAIAIVAAFVNLPGASGTVKFLYYAAVTMVFWLCYTFYTIPYYAVVAEITQDYDERTRIRGTSSLINTGAICLGNILPAVLPALFVGMGLSISMGWLPMVAVLAVLAMVFGIIAVRSLRHAKLLKVDAPVEGGSTSSKPCCPY
jgi:glycoside/pentoside/hexuronide:cation symporter, GPH family